MIITEDLKTCASYSGLCLGLCLGSVSFPQCPLTINQLNVKGV